MLREQPFAVRGDHVTLGQLLHACGLITSGGEARLYVEDGRVLVNGSPETRRGRKLRPGDVVEARREMRIRLIASEGRDGV